MSKKPKLTTWFPYRVKPIHVGVYEVKYLLLGSIDYGYAYWTGKEWTNAWNSVQRAYRNRTWISGAIQEKSWRGLAEDPQGGKA